MAPSSVKATFPESIRTLRPWCRSCVPNYRTYWANTCTAPTCTAVSRAEPPPGTSDLDALAVLHNTPTDTDRTTVRTLETELDRRFCQINGAGILLHSILSLTNPAERHDGGFFLACLCTPLLGPDLAHHPSHEPADLNLLLHDLAPWLAHTYTAAHGTKT